jgi:quercetin dioxygenase-like cupin family protein
MAVELDVAHPLLLAPGTGQGEAIVDTPARELRVLCEHDLLNATWTRHTAGERGAEPHIHLHHVDAFYVLAGVLALRVGPDLAPMSAPAGTLVLVPPGLVHGFDNDGPGELRFLNFHAPGAGFAEYLRGRGQFDQHEPPADGGRPASDAVVTPPGGGERFQRDDRIITILGELPQISALRLEVEPGWPGIAAHEHVDHVDTFFVLEGEAGLVRGDDVARAGAGSFYAAPPGTRHGVLNVADGQIAFLNVHAPDADFAASTRRLSMDARRRYDEICDDLVARNPEVALTQMMGMPAVKADGKLVCGWVQSADAMVFKLSEATAHAAALGLAGAHLFDPGGNGRPFRQWVVVPAGHAPRWPGLAEQALSQRAT